MWNDIVPAMQVVDKQATEHDMFDACKRLFTRSDLYTHSLQDPFARCEVNAVANAIWEYIREPDSPAIREIRFRVSRPLLGKSIECCEFASSFSEDLLYDNYSVQFTSLSGDELRSSLKVFFVAILFRYRFCVDEDRAAFPVSVVLDYLGCVEILLSRERREGDLTNALWRTLKALRSLEPQWPRSVGDLGLA